MELTMWGVWTLLLLWYLSALRGDIRGAPEAGEMIARVDNASPTAASRQT